MTVTPGIAFAYEAVVVTAGAAGVVTAGVVTAGVVTTGAAGVDGVGVDAAGATARTAEAGAQARLDGKRKLDGKTTAVGEPTVVPSNETISRDELLSYKIFVPSGENTGRFPGLFDPEVPAYTDTLEPELSVLIKAIKLSVAMPR